MAEAKLYAVAGNPVLHSRSPDMFNAAFRAMSIQNRYLRFAAWDAEEIVETMRDIPVTGVNVTAPFKEEVARRLEDVDNLSIRTGAINTVISDGGKLRGFNTDIEGVRGAFAAGGIEARGRRALVFGAGGAARAAVAALLSLGVEVTVINRTYGKAEVLAQQFSCRAVPIEKLGFAIQGVQVLISCLSTPERVIPATLLRRDMVILDAFYGKETSLVRDGKEVGCTVIDGREWLLHQGAAAFRHFTGAEAPVDVMRDALYKRGTTQKRSVALIGFMGAGKSAVGGALARLMEMPFVDIDDEIERKEGKTVSDIFAHQGEATFRRMESAEIEARMKDTDAPAVIACGGGAVLDRGNVTRLRKRCLVVWLYANPAVILQRVRTDNTRPLLTGENKKERIEELLKKRLFFYADTADMLIRTDRKAAEEIAKRIYDESSHFIGH